MESNKIQKNTHSLLKKIEKDLDDGCEVHKYLMPDGRCNCSGRIERITDNALRLIAELNLGSWGLERIKE